MDKSQFWWWVLGTAASAVMMSKTETQLMSIPSQSLFNPQEVCFLSVKRVDSPGLKTNVGQLTLFPQKKPHSLKSEDRRRKTNVNWSSHETPTECMEKANPVIKHPLEGVGHLCDTQHLLFICMHPELTLFGSETMGTAPCSYYMLLFKDIMQCNAFYLYR